MNEYKYNIDTFEKTKMQKISQNQPFQMMHLASGRFLACHEVESTYENQNYQIRLDDFTSDASVFTIIPAYTF
jgi:inositol 1,4,5-triphosphate receptor type 1/inositol 1,4,5-triphosphate receptor type 3